MPRDVVEFFEHYQDAFDRLDGEAIADLYCVPSAIVSDRGLTTWQSREPISENMVALCALYRAMATSMPVLSRIISLRKAAPSRWLTWRGPSNVKLARSRGTSTRRTIFVGQLKAGALCYVPRMKSSVSTPNPSLNRTPAGGLSPAGRSPVSLVR
jgi:hypothetical protein